MKPKGESSVLVMRDGDILDSGADVICHQVNCVGVMGAGLAYQVAVRYPSVYEEYKTFVRESEDRSRLLGQVQFCRVNGSQKIANLFAQVVPSRTGIQTDYVALECCLWDVRRQNPGKTIAIPYRIGCGLGGGNWGVVTMIIEEVFKGFDGRVEIWKL